MILELMFLIRKYVFCHDFLNDFFVKAVFQNKKINNESNKILSKPYTNELKTKTYIKF